MLKLQLTLDKRLSRDCVIFVELFV